MKPAERVVSPEDLSNDPNNVDIAKVVVDDQGGIMFIGSLSADEFIEWQETRDSGNAEVKKNASAVLMMRSLVKGPDKNEDGAPLSAEQRVAAAVRTGTQAHVAAFRKAKISRTERLLKAILKLNYINQKDEVAIKNS